MEYVLHNYIDIRSFSQATSLWVRLKCQYNYLERNKRYPMLEFANSRIQTSSLDVFLRAS